MHNSNLVGSYLVQHFLFHALHHTLGKGLSEPLHMQNDHENEIWGQDNTLLQGAGYANCIHFV